MIVYLVFLFTVSGLCFFRIKLCATGKYIYPFAFWGWLAIIIFAGLRYGIGTDYYSYESIFLSLNKGGEYNDSLEIGFKFLASFFSSTKYGFYCFIFVTSAITNILFLASLYREGKFLSENLKVFGVLLFFLTSTYFWPFNGIRQGVACAFVAYSLRYIFERRLVCFIICILLASTFHKSALIVISFYFLYSIKVPSLFYFFIVIISIVIHQVGIVSSFSSLILPYLGEKYARYIYNPLDFGGTGLGVYVYVMLFFMLWAFRNVLVIVKKTKQIDVLKRIDFLLCIYAIGVVFRVFALENLIFVRFAYYFTIFDMFFIPLLISQFNGFFNKAVLSAIFIFLYSVLFVNSILNANDLIPYQSIIFR
ncbi:TPA: EpsG family protein [Escherichia albertii]